MSKNVTINGTNYEGVSTVKLNTIAGGTATFKDIDEITTSGAISGTRHEFTINMASATYTGSCECTLQPTSYIAKIYTENPETLPTTRLVNAYVIVDTDTSISGESNMYSVKTYTGSKHSADNSNYIQGTLKSLPTFDGTNVTWNVGTYYEAKRDYKLVIIELDGRM